MSVKTESYLCGMKTIKLIIVMAFVFCLNMPIHAQFNTIGTVSNKRIKTGNPPKPDVTLTDGDSSADSISAPFDSANKGNVKDVTPLQHSDNAPLVSLPLKKMHINSGFGMRKHPIYHKYIMHNGVDLQARYEDVYSMFPGTVIRVGQDKRSGKFVTVRTGDYTISYCHLSQQLVKVNDFVYAGKHIAVSGNTGASTGPHLHITAKKDGKAFNPVALLELITERQ